METLTIRDTRVALPSVDDSELQSVSSIDTIGDPVSYFDYRDQSVRLLELLDGRLHDGRIEKVSTERTHIDGVRLSSVEISDCDLSSLVITDSKLSRVRFTDCRFLGARLSAVTLEEVVFDRCRLDYATFTQVIAKGSVVFIGCTLTEAEFDRCDLGRVAFSDCRLNATNFGPGTYRGVDLRENDLSSILGVVNLRQAVIADRQVIELANALVADLDLTFGEDT